MELKNDPYRVFESSQSPIAVHARLRWMNGGKQDKAMAAGLVTKVRREQSADGSWDGSVCQTIHSLFALWLLQEGPDRCTGKAVNWMVEAGSGGRGGGMCSPGGVYHGLFFGVGGGDREALRKIAGVPFTPGCGGFVKTGAALFFASVFKQGDAERVQQAYERLNCVGIERNGKWCSWPCGNNILQAFALHPEYRASKAMRKAAARLGECQSADGAWGEGIPFYPTLFALGHVRQCPNARAQVGRALRYAAGKQNRDGSWGRTQREAQTFMVLHAKDNTVSHACKPARPYPSPACSAQAASIEDPLVKNS